MGQLARLAGITVRTLHHYRKDPAAPRHSQARGESLPRGRKDLRRLPVCLCGPPAGARAELARRRGQGVLGLRRQHGLLRERLERTQAMVTAVEKEMEARQMGISLTPEERFEMFGAGFSDDHQAEAEERWGDTAAWAQSRRRTSAYSKEDWLRIKAEADDVQNRFAEVMRSGAAADSAPAMQVAEDHRQHISRWFYDCPPQMHAGLGRMYVEDERFAATYEQTAPGLARFVSTAVQANAARRDG